MEKKSIEQRARILLDGIIIEPDTADLLCSLNKYSKRTFIHCLNVAFMSVQIGFNWGMDSKRLIDLAKGAVLHDIGKIKIPLSILEKKGALTQEEFEQIKLHPVYGYELAMMKGYGNTVLDIILHHHEHIDGTGYPDGNKVTGLLQETQIVSVVDAWDAMTSARSYKPELSGQDAMLELTDFTDSFYNNEAVRGLRNVTDK